MIFVDSSFWIALSLARDTMNALARELASAQRPVAWMTTNHIVGETWTFLRRHATHDHAVRFLDRVKRSSRISVTHVTEEQERAALDWLRRHDERPYSLVDATSFTVMKELGLTDALAFDGDFSAAGFIELRA